MKHYIPHLIVVILLLILVIPVSADNINASSVIARLSTEAITIDSGWASTYSLDLQTGGFFAGGFGGFGGGGAGGRADAVNTGTNKDYQGRVVAQQIITYEKENAVMTWKYYRISGEVISGTITLVPDSGIAFGGTRTIYINENAFTTTDRYTRIPVFNTVTAASLYMVVVVDPATKQEYFTLTTGLGGNAGTQVKWDNSTYANMPLNTHIIADPIYKCEFSAPNQQFNILTYAVKLQDFTTSYKDAIAAPSTSNPLSFLGWLLQPLQDAVNRFVEFGKLAAGFFTGAYALAAFIFAGTIIIGVSAFYTAIALLLSIEDSDDIFKAFGRFWRYEMKLFRFYMEIFKAIKELIKWW